MLGDVGPKRDAGRAGPRATNPLAQHGPGIWARHGLTCTGLCRARVDTARLTPLLIIELSTFTRLRYKICVAIHTHNLEFIIITVFSSTDVFVVLLGYQALFL